MILRLEFANVGGRFALVLLPLGAPTSPWATGPFVAVTQSAEGISVVCQESAVPPDTTARMGFHCLQIAGSFEIESVGVVAAAVLPLAQAGISVFVYSTWETDYILFQHNELERAVNALIQAGHTVRS